MKAIIEEVVNHHLKDKEYDHAAAKNLADSEVNLVEAHAWAAKATNNEHAEGNSLKDEIEENLSPMELSQARRLFATWQIESRPSALPNR